MNNESTHSAHTMDNSMTDQQILSTSPMKQSVSLTSLPPSTSHGAADVSDSSVAKIFIERPYNSLKVCIPPYDRMVGV